MTRQEIERRQADILARLTELNARAHDADADPLTADEEREFDDLTAETERLAGEHRDLVRDARLAHVTALSQQGGAVPGSAPDARGKVLEGMDRDILGEPDSIEAKRFRAPFNLDEVRTFGREPADVGRELRARALSAIESGAMQGMSPEVRQTATQILERWDNENGDLARLALVSGAPEYLTAFGKAARGDETSFTEAERRAVSRVRAEQRAMGLTDASGGFLIPFQLDPTLIVTSAGSYNEIRQIARTVVATGDVWNGVSAGAVVWSWDAEAAEVSDDSPTLAQPAIPVHMARGFVPISIEAIADAQNVAAEIGGLLAEGKEDLESVAFILGTGTGQPTGIITTLAAGQTITAAADDTFAIGDVYSLHDALPQKHRSRASWLANNSIYSLTRRFDTAGGAGMWAQLGEGRPDGLIGKPVYEAEAMDGTVTVAGATNNYIMVFGNFTNYVIADRIGTTVEFIPHLFGAAFRPTGQRGWFAYYRVGADSVNDTAFRRLNVVSAA